MNYDIEHQNSLLITSKGLGGSSIAAFLLNNMGQEVWKQVKDYEGYYEVSNLGRVKSCAKRWSVGRKEETILKPAHRPGEYDFVIFCVDKIKKQMTVHRLVALHFCDNPNNYPVVNHLDSDIYNNKWDNLEWTTSSGNSIHGYEHGNRIKPKGQLHPKCKLSNEVVIEIRKRRSNGETVSSLSKEFSISIAQVSRIVNGRRWSHI